MPKDTKSLDNNKAPACESRGFVHKKKEGVHFDTPSSDIEMLFFKRILYFCSNLCTFLAHLATYLCSRF